MRSSLIFVVLLVFAIACDVELASTEQASSRSEDNSNSRTSSALREKGMTTGIQSSYQPKT